MTKVLISFLAGVLAMAVVVYVTGARLSTPMFFAGALAVLVPQIAFLCSVDRMRSAARFLNAFADAWGKKAEQPRPIRHRVADLSGYRKPSTKQRDQIMDDTISEYLGDTDDVFAPPSERRASL